MEALALPQDPPASRSQVPWNPRFAAYYRENFGRVVRWVRVLGVEAGEAEDVAQQVFLVVAKSIAGGVIPSCGGLYQTVRRGCANHRRGRARRFAREAKAPAPSEVPMPDEAAERARAAVLFEHFLRSLPDDQRECFVLYEVDGMSAPEVARTLGIEPDLVHGRVRLVRGKLRRFVAARRAAAQRGLAGPAAGREAGDSRSRN